MIIDVKNMKGEKVSEVELPEAIFEAPIYIDLMHQAYVRQMANARLGTHETKTRHEVAGGGKKPFKQKGTGRARQGSIRAAQWKGGGRVHTPHMRDYTQAMPKKMRRAALRSALSVKAGESQIVVVDELKLVEPKTRLMALALNALVGSSSALILVPDVESTADVVRATNNLPDAKILRANYLNIRDLLSFDHVILPVAAIETISAYLG
ncbi:50S ribosomal protein L4 [Flexilinea flocculi]|jgi:large subunit ribosomal protein L4|uniref:Large ribosomal subunit protein uL4 n=1 Tax=Flexilinea flocculi TaxID=1678840 RepID=A0A0K8PAU4_9CHLR|nr:50S ribosomal protein L4 [Flexilinea flocculi]NMB93274.1 50S ribosomal protein L4 [Flexilinea flocculi]GAP39778.1 50S ribosomal protein L4, bacterial/organelle [Flexilinea flocculi]